MDRGARRGYLSRERELEGTGLRERLLLPPTAVT